MFTVSSDSSFPQPNSDASYSLKKQRREALVSAGMKPTIEYFIKGGRNLEHEFFLNLHNQDILIEREYLDSQVMAEVKATATIEQLESIKIYENSIYERVTNALVLLFPEFKAPSK